MCLWTDEPGQIRSRRCRDGMVANKYAVLPNINCPPMRYCKLKWVLLLLRLALHIFFAGVDIYWINLLLTGGICSVSENRRVLSPPLSSVLNSYTSSPLPFFFLLSSVPKIVLWAKIQFKDSKWQTHLGNRLMKQLLSFSHRPGFFCFARGSKGKLVY